MDLTKIISNRNTRLSILNFLRFIPDKTMLKIQYRMKIGKKLNLRDPQTFNEKLQWLKLNDRKPIYTTMVDKFDVREYVIEKIGEDYLVPIYGCWDSVDAIPFDIFPDSFVIKCTHDSGSIILCKDKKTLDIEYVKKRLNQRLKKNPFYYGREWPYKYVKPRVIVEEYMEDSDNEHLPVYKVFCFNGEPKIIQTIQNDKQPNETVDYFNLHWEKLDIRQRFPNSEKLLEKPKKLDEILDISRVLSEGTYFIRIDFYVVNGKVYFSEHTFYTDSGYSIFEPENWDGILGDWIKI